MATDEQIQHIEANQELFNEHQMRPNADVREYFREYSYIPDLYFNVCNDLGLDPIS